MKWAVTFGQRFNHEEHPVDPRITGNSFVVVEGTEEQARAEAFRLLKHWAFIYPYEDGAGQRDLDFQRQIRQHGLEEVVLGDGPPERLAPVYVPALGQPSWQCPHCKAVDRFRLAEYGWFYSRVSFAKDGTIEDQMSVGESVQDYELKCTDCGRVLLMPEEER